MKTHVESVAERDFLRTEGDPAAVGYTINEAVALTRSMVCLHSCCLYYLSMYLGNRKCDFLRSIYSTAYYILMV
jgi:hypothetical protein